MISWEGLTVVYFTLGALCACAMIAAFRPIEGYRPSLGIYLLAFVVFSLFWPIILLLSIVYFIGTIYRFMIGETVELRLLGILYCRTKLAGVSPRPKRN